MTLEPRTEIPKETLPSERLMVVTKGSLDQLVNGSFVTLRAFEREVPDGTPGGL